MKQDLALFSLCRGAYQSDALWHSESPAFLCLTMLRGVALCKNAIVECLHNSFGALALAGALSFGGEVANIGLALIECRSLG